MHLNKCYLARKHIFHQLFDLFIGIKCIALLLIDPR